MKIEHYDLQVILQYDKRSFVRYYSVYGGSLNVKGTLQLLNDGHEPENNVSFGLYRLFDVLSIKHQGRNIPFSHEVLSFADHHRLQFSKITVQLPGHLAPGERCKLDIEYGGPLCGYIEAFPYVKDHVSERFTLLRAETMWYPCANIQDNNTQMPFSKWPEFTYRLKFKVPPGQVAVAKGRLAERIASTNIIQYVWEQSEPAVMISAAIAPYRVVQFNPFKVYSFAEHEPLAQQVVQCVSFTLEWCKKHLGEPIRHSELTLVEVPEGYGSFVDGIIFQTADAFRLNEGSPAEVARRFGYIAHEVAHLWSVFSSEEQSSRFLDESLTHYVEALIIGARFGREYYLERLEDYRKGLLKAGTEVLERGILAGRERGELVTVLSRRKGPLAAAVLHCLLGDVFFSVLRDFTQSHGNCQAAPEELLRMWRKHARFDFDLFVRHWFTGALPEEFLSLTIEQIAGHYTQI